MLASRRSRSAASIRCTRSAATACSTRLRASNGADSEPPVAFLPPSARPSALIWVDGMVYTSTSNECGAAPNAVWAIDLTATEPKPAVWKTGGANVAGTSGPALGTTGDLYVALSAKAPRPPRAARRRHADGDAVVVLDGHTLRVKDWFSAPGADFNTSPIVIRDKDRGSGRGGRERRTAVPAGRKVGRRRRSQDAALRDAEVHRRRRRRRARHLGERRHALDSRARRRRRSGGRDDRRRTASTPNGAIVAFKLVDQGGKPTLEPAWSSRDLTSPLGPIVVNGMVFAASSGEYRGDRRPADRRPARATIDSRRALSARRARPARNCGAAARR